MSKKMMLLALAVAALFALPSAASAQEIHINGSHQLHRACGAAGFARGSRRADDQLYDKHDHREIRYRQHRQQEASNSTFTGCDGGIPSASNATCNTSGAPSETITIERDLPRHHNQHRQTGASW